MWKTKLRRKQDLIRLHLLKRNSSHFVRRSLQVGSQAGPWRCRTRGLATVAWDQRLQTPTSTRLSPPLVGVVHFSLSTVTHRGYVGRPPCLFALLEHWRKNCLLRVSASEGAPSAQLWPACASTSVPEESARTLHDWRHSPSKKGPESWRGFRMVVSHCNARLWKKGAAWARNSHGPLKMQRKTENCRVRTRREACSWVMCRMSLAGIEVKPFLEALIAPALPLPKRREGRYGKRVVRRHSSGYTGLNGGNASAANEILFTPLNGRRGPRHLRTRWRFWTTSVAWFCWDQGWWLGVVSPRNCFLRSGSHAGTWRADGWRARLRMNDLRLCCLRHARGVPFPICFANMITRCTCNPHECHKMGRRSANYPW